MPESYEVLNSSKVARKLIVASLYRGLSNIGYPMQSTPGIINYITQWGILFYSTLGIKSPLKEEFNGDTFSFTSSEVKYDLEHQTLKGNEKSESKIILDEYGSTIENTIRYIYDNYYNGVEGTDEAKREYLRLCAVTVYVEKSTPGSGIGKYINFIYNMKSISRYANKVGALDELIPSYDETDTILDMDEDTILDMDEDEIRDLINAKKYEQITKYAISKVQGNMSQPYVVEVVDNTIKNYPLMRQLKKKIDDETASEDEIKEYNKLSWRLPKEAKEMLDADPNQSEWDEDMHRAFKVIIIKSLIAGGIIDDIEGFDNDDIPPLAYKYLYNINIGNNGKYVASMPIDAVSIEEDEDLSGKYDKVSDFIEDDFSSKVNNPYYGKGISFESIINDIGAKLDASQKNDLYKTFDISTLKRLISNAPDFITKNAGNFYDNEELIKEAARLLDDDYAQTAKSSEVDSMLPGNSDYSSKLRSEIVDMANGDLDIFLSGPVGAGKTTIAKMIHQLDSRRANKPFIEVNCSQFAQNPQLAHSELFGHVKGSFTGATKDKAGKFREAHGGTIFLDEIHNLDLSTQNLLLKAVEEKIVTPLGGDKQFSIDGTRIITATNRNLGNMVKIGEFKKDLLSRLTASYNLEIPALNKRRNDIEEIASSIISNMNAKAMANKRIDSPLGLSNDSIELLIRIDYDDNIRTLRSALSKAFEEAMRRGDAEIRPQHFTSGGVFKQFSIEKIKDEIKDCINDPKICSEHGLDSKNLKVLNHERTLDDIASDIYRKISTIARVEGQSPSDIISNILYSDSEGRLRILIFNEIEDKVKSGEDVIASRIVSYRDDIINKIADYIYDMPGFDKNDKINITRKFRERYNFKDPAILSKAMEEVYGSTGDVIDVSALAADDIEEIIKSMASQLGTSGSNMNELVLNIVEDIDRDDQNSDFTMYVKQLVEPECITIDPRSVGFDENIDYDNDIISIAEEL